jgi:hypothetical protein
MTRFLAALGLTGLLSCTPVNPSPPSPPPSPGLVDAATIWAEFVEAGCVADTDGGALAISEEEALDADSWLYCMQHGGSVYVCNAPCGQSD